MVHGAASTYVVKLQWWHGTRHMDITPSSTVPSRWILSESSAARAQCSHDRWCFFELSALGVPRCTEACDGLAALSK